MGSSVLNTKVCGMFGCKYPIIQTAMGWVATPELVAGTCNAGGFGFFAAATIRAEEIDGAIARIKELTDRPFGVNFLMEQPGAERIVDAIIANGVKAASYGRAPNAQVVEKFKKAGVLCVPTIGAVRHAVKAIKLGADIVIAQGGEGGGHTGVVPTSILVPQVVDSVEVPVMAAGGFHDGRGLVAALAYGASGIAMGTRFLLTRESPLPEETAKRYFSAGVNDVFVTREVDGMPQRVIQNEFVNRLESSNAFVALIRALRSGLVYRKFSGASIPDLLKAALAMRRGDKLTRRQAIMAANSLVFIKKAMVDGNPNEGVLPSGTVVGLLDDRPTCEDLIQRIIREAEQTLARLTQE